MDGFFCINQQAAEVLPYTSSSEVWRVTSQLLRWPVFVYSCVYTYRMIFMNTWHECTCDGERVLADKLKSMQTWMTVDMMTGEETYDVDISYVNRTCFYLLGSRNLFAKENVLLVLTGC